MIVTGDWAVTDYSTPATTGKAAKAGDEKLDLGVAPLPKIDSTGKSPVPFNNGRAFFFGTKSTGDQLKASKLFVEYLAKPEQQAEILNKAFLLPATKAFLASEAVQKDSIWSGLYAALELSKPQPTAPEMTAIWAAIRPNLEGVVANTIKPEDAANKMQQMALDKIKLLNK
jgi:maltose-binding protein MalE